jgi:hypothetical protein
VSRSNGPTRFVAGESTRFYLRRGSRNRSFSGMAKSHGRAMAAVGGAGTALSVEKLTS